MSLVLEPVSYTHLDVYKRQMQATGHLVTVVVELATRVENGHDDFRRRDLATQLGAHLRVLTNRDAATVVGDRDRAIRMDRYRHMVGVARQGFICLLYTSRCV